MKTFYVFFSFPPFALIVIIFIKITIFVHIFCIFFRFFFVYFHVTYKSLTSLYCSLFLFFSTFKVNIHDIFLSFLPENYFQEYKFIVQLNVYLDILIIKLFYTYRNFQNEQNKPLQSFLFSPFFVHNAFIMRLFQKYEIFLIYFFCKQK